MLVHRRLPHPLPDDNSHWHFSPTALLPRPRGLKFKGVPMQAIETFQRVPLSVLHANPDQPRRFFDDDELLQLSESIKNHGVLQPILVRRAGEGFQIIAGERRFRAAQVVGLSDVPVQIVDFNDQKTFEAALVENIQRSDLNPIDKAVGFREYCDRYGMSKEELASRLGIDRSTVSNLIAVLDLPADVQNALRNNQISLGHAKALRSIADPAEQIALCKQATLKGLSVKAFELLVRTAKAEKETLAAVHEEVKPETHRTPHIESLESEIRARLATRFEIRLKGRERGQLVIHFETGEEFERLVERLQAA
jgi:ParB family transcriptional regulator, chromosome partitioning protein